MTLRFRIGDPLVVRARLFGPRGAASVRLLLDTGASRTMLSPRRLMEIGVDASVVPRDYAMTTVSGTAYAPIVSASRFAALGVVRPDFAIVAHTLPPSAPIDGLLGLDFLVGLRLTLDMRAGVLTVDA